MTVKKWNADTPAMIKQLKKLDGICFKCPDFEIGHSEAGYSIARTGDHHRSIPENEALDLVNKTVLED